MARLNDNQVWSSLSFSKIQTITGTVPEMEICRYLKSQADLQPLSPVSPRSYESHKIVSIAT